MGWLYHQLLRSRPRAILREFGVEHQVPVDIRALLRELGVDVCSTLGYDRVPDWSVALDLRETKPRIWLRHTELESYQRFSLAHALGHLILHPQLSPLHRDITYRGTQHEYEANRFAGDLLVPEHLLLPRALKDSDVHRLSDEFQVSGALMRYQLLRVTG